MLSVLNLDEALDLVRQHLGRVVTDRAPGIPPIETVPLDRALGRRLAAPILAPFDVPPFDRSQVDGMAVHAADTFGASETTPAILRFAGEVHMGQAETIPLAAGHCMAVPTGGLLPPGADAMVMIESVELLDLATRLITHSVSPGNQVTRRGDDAKAGQTVIPAGRLLGSQEIGALAALGLHAVEVAGLSLRVGILSTGDELVDAAGPASSGMIHDVNGPMLAASVREAGAVPIPYGIVPDQLDQVQAALGRALLETDLVLISGGSSVGSRDFVEPAIQAAGQPGLLFHGLAIKPGKPTLAGLCDGKLVFGLPGHPVAAWFVFEQLVRPILNHLRGVEPPSRPTIAARTTCRIPSNHGRAEFLLVRLVPDPTPDHTDWLAQPLATRSGLVTLLAASDGYICIPRDCEGLAEQEPVTVHLLRNLESRVQP
jgi:molybdopterin molybdotransferase